MTTLIPRQPYTDDELRKLYPPGLELQLVQILMRHGERTPVSARFQNAGLRPFWPYCASARQMRSAVLEDPGDGSSTSGAYTRAPFSTLEWKRRLETFGPRDEPVLASGPGRSGSGGDDIDDVCDMGSLTDEGRQSTYRLGQRLRSLYVDRLGFLPPAIRSADDLQQMYLRSTPIPRALESLQQTFAALYPAATRQQRPAAGAGAVDADGQASSSSSSSSSSPSIFPPPTIITRAPGDETLFPNDTNCRRFAALSRAFAQRAAERWNDTPEMAYLNSKLGRWMPADSPRVAVDSHPRLSGVLDTVNSTLAHGPATRLPREFYDDRARRILERVAVEEWFAGYGESREYRMLGIGGLLGDVVGRMVGSAEHRGAQSSVRFGLSGCHDTTLAAVLASMGTMDPDKWPPYTSHIAIEMFRRASVDVSASAVSSPKRSWWGGVSASASAPSAGIGRKPTTELTPAEAKKLDGYYVRMRYNDEPVVVPGCKLPGNHLEGDESFCTLAAFKAIVDKFTPQDWRQQCHTNIKGPAMPKGEPEWAGY